MSTSSKRIRVTPSSAVLSAISIAGFKSINEERHLKLGYFNILAGANSAGKSSFLQPLLLLKQTLEATYDPGPLLIDGPNVRFTSLSQIFSKTSSKQKTMSIGLASQDGRELKLLFDVGSNKQLRIKQNIHIENDGTTRVISEQLSPEEIEKLVKLSGFPTKSPFDNAVASIERERAFLRLQFRIEDERLFQFPMSALDGFGENIGRNIIHVPGLRGNPERSYKKTAVGQSFPGTLDSYVASIVADWQDNDSEKIELLGKQLLQLGLTWKINAKKVDDTRVELQVGRLPSPAQGGARDVVSIADVGFGVSQVLPVLVALLVSKKGQIVYIEQPETHLHPKAQRALAQIFADAIHRKSLVIVETHSLIFVRAVQTLVASQQLDKDAVKLHWIARDLKGQTQITTGGLDEAGAYGDWPQDFESTEMDAEQAYIDAAEKRLLSI